MSSQELPQVSVDNVLALSTEELVQFMKQNLGSNGSFNLPIKDCDNLSKDQRDQFAEKLRFGAQMVHDTVKSRPVDFDQVAARLQSLSDSQNALPQTTFLPSRQDREPTEEVDGEEMMRQYESFAYNELVKDGGRPAFDIKILSQVSENPEEYRELLQPWQKFPYTSPPGWKGVLSTQLTWWTNFRRWQKETRGIFNNDAEYLAHIEMTKRQYTWCGETRVLSQLEADPSSGRYAWSWMEQERLRDYWYLRKNHGHGGFPEYVEEVNDSLAQHGFTQTIQLDKDPGQQDRLTTWIEYLSYEYSWYDRFCRNFKALQSKYDDAWQQLVNSAVLKPLETDENIRTTKAAMRFQSELDQAEAEVKSARAAAAAVLSATQKEPQRSRLAKPVRIQMMLRAHARLQSAGQSRAAAKKRSDLLYEFINGTRWYSKQRAKAENQSILLQWILDQIPLIASELDSVEAVEGTTDVQRGTKRRRERDQDDVAPLGRKLAEPRCDEVMVESIRHAKEQLQRSHGCNPGDERSLQQPRINSPEPVSQYQAHGDSNAAFITTLQATKLPAIRRRSDSDSAVVDASEVSSNCPPLSPDPTPLPSIENAESGSMERKRGREHDQDEIGPAQNHKRQKRDAPRKGSHADTTSSETFSNHHTDGWQLHDSLIQTSTEVNAPTLGQRNNSPPMPLSPP